MFNVLRTCRLFQSVWTILHLPQQRVRVPVLHALAKTYFMLFGITADLAAVTWHVMVVLICIFLVTEAFEHLSCACGPHQGTFKKVWQV